MAHSPGCMRRVIYPSWPRRHPVASITLLLLVGLAVLDRGFGWFGQPDDFTRYHTRSFRVVRVVDGDTLDIDISDERRRATRVRLWGVDAPETPGTHDGDMVFGPEAAAFAKRTLLDKSVRIELSPTKTRGRHGRLLAYVHLEPGGRCFNELLLETGHAYADGRFPHPRKREYAAIEARARRQEAGLWAVVTPAEYPPWRRRTERWKADRDAAEHPAPRQATASK